MKRNSSSTQQRADKPGKVAVPHIKTPSLPQSLVGCWSQVGWPRPGHQAPLVPVAASPALELTLVRPGAFTMIVAQGLVAISLFSLCVGPLFTPTISRVVCLESG